MTLPPERIGGKGQRWFVECTGYPDSEAMGWKPIGYCSTHEAAQRLFNSIGQAPGAKHIRIVDRSEAKP